MRICFLIPSVDHLTQAGVRIRYRRLEEILRKRGHEICVVPIQELAGQAQFGHDVYIVSKCYDARSQIIAYRLAESQKLVGIDLFDDYFSQTDNSQLGNLRRWLDAMVKSVDFILCATPTMVDAARASAPGLAIAVLRDSAPPIDAEQLSARLKGKNNDLQKTNTLKVGWFGIGDNPYFPVGLRDLVAYGGELARLGGRGLDIQLRILTNRRAMKKAGLAMLRRLPVPYTVVEWTETREQALLADCQVCFLPVNAQRFSIVKSINRAVSALSAGAQVLSSGYPLYEPLSRFIYCDPVELRGDLQSGNCHLREQTVPQFADLLKVVADPATEVGNLIGFLEEQQAYKPNRLAATGYRRLAAVIHGLHSTGETQEFAENFHMLSVASPYSNQSLRFDIQFRFAASDDGLQAYGLQADVGEQAELLLGPECKAYLQPWRKFGNKRYRELELSQLLPQETTVGAALGSNGTTVGVTTSYAHVMALIEAVVMRLFPGITCILAEQSELPVWRKTSNESRLQEVN